MRESIARRPWLLDWALVLLLLCLALAVRFYQLESIPSGLYNDEAAYANDALNVQAGQHAIFFPRNYGREPLFIYLLALAFDLFGSTPYVIRATAAAVGALTVPAAYLLVTAVSAFEAPKRWLLARWAGLLVGLLMAFSYWHLSFSRLGFRAITLPLVMCLAFLFVWRAWRRMRDETTLPWSDLILAGALLGGTFYTYTAGRMAVPLFAFLAIATFLQPARLGIARRRLLAATAVVAAIFLLVALPLTLYFVQNPEVFSSRAVTVSIFSKVFAPEGPVAAVAANVVDTAAMFLSKGDPNERHNPARIPAFDPLLGLWLFAGVIVAAVQWRRLPQIFWLAWVGLMAVPALLSAEGMPHALRTIGMLPAVYALPVAAMLWVGTLLPSRWRHWGPLVPLPFLLLSAVFGVRAYFSAWQNPNSFRAAFLTDYVELGKSLALMKEDDLWLLTLSPAYGVTEERIETLDFFVRGAVPVRALLLQPERFASGLAQALGSGRQVHLLRPFDAPQLTETSAVFLDTKNLADFVLRRSGRQLGDGEIDGFPYTTYAAPTTKLLVPPTVARPPQPFGGHVELVASAFGGPMDAAQPDGTPSLPADQPLWSVLRWRALTPIDQDLKTSLQLVDEAGNVAAQADGLLTGDRYPVERVWETGEETNTYHILEAFPAVPPGEYRLVLRVYEDQSGKVHPATGADGEALPAFELGRVELTPPNALPSVAPMQATTAPTLAGLTLAGVDLPTTTFSPGDALAATLYWQAPAQPATNLERRIVLRDEAGDSVAESVAPPGGAGYPTDSWRAGESVRDRADLRLPPDLPAGEYTLQVSLVATQDGASESDAASAGADLATIRIAGRPRLFDAPSLESPAAATFAETVQLLGAQSPAAIETGPGAPIAFDLVWQVLATTTDDLVRFTHLLDAEGRLVAQQDAVPCTTECPSPSWLAGEVLVDRVELMTPTNLAPGSYTVVTGWYNPATQQRLPARDGAGEPVANDAATLPVTVQVIAP
ncbi:MAG: hypothetical protein ACRC1H_11825 [Caldilineaceae bacterium]